MDTIKIRIFQSNSPSETLQCQSIIRSAWIDHDIPQSFVDRYIITIHDLTDIEQNYLKPSGSNFWVAEDTSEKTNLLVGTVALQPISLGDKQLYEEQVADSSKRYFPNISPDEICELKRLYVLSSYQKKKIGYKLLQTLLDFARISGYKAVHLISALDWKQANQFYERVGFERGRVVCFCTAGMKEGEEQIIFKQEPKSFESIKDLKEEDWEEINRPIQESTIAYVQHYWMKL